MFFFLKIISFHSSPGIFLNHINVLNSSWNFLWLFLKLSQTFVIAFSEFSLLSDMSSYQRSWFVWCQSHILCRRRNGDQSAFNSPVVGCTTWFTRLSHIFSCFGAHWAKPHKAQLNVAISVFIINQFNHKKF